MSELRATTQAELDAILARTDLNYDDFEIVISSPAGVWVTISDGRLLDVMAYGSATVRASGSATVMAYESATVRAYGSATVEAYDRATVRASGSATVRAYGSATVEAYGSATVEAYDSATVMAYESATVEAYDRATARASGNATVRAYGSATVRASGSATVMAYESATVEASGSATVEASGSATVEAYDRATVRASGSATVMAYDRATVRASGRATVRASGSATVRASGSATVRAYGSATVRAGQFVAIHLFSQLVTLEGGVLIDMTQIDETDPRQWCDHHGIELDEDGTAHLYKAVNSEWMAGHNYVPTSYLPGTDPECDTWRDDNDCGGGLHACPTAWQAFDHYREATRFVEVTCPVESLRPIDSTKAKAPRVHVLREVTRDMVPVGVSGDE